MSNEITGTIVVIEDIMHITETFQKREFVLEVIDNNPEYPELIKFEVIKDKCYLLDSFQIGQEVSISYNVKGRKWTDKQGKDKYFNTLQAWKINAGQGQGQMPGPAPAPYQQTTFTQIAPTAPAPNFQETIDSEDVPF